MSTIPLPIQIGSEAKWIASAKAHGVKGVNIFELAEYDSASKIGEAQYLALRAVWKRKQKAQFDAKLWGLQDIDIAQKLLSKVPQWQAFLAAVPLLVPLDKILPVTDLGRFELTWYYGQLIRAAPSAPDNDDNLIFTPVAKRTRSKTWQPDPAALLQTPTNPRQRDLSRTQEPAVSPPTSYSSDSSKDAQEPESAKPQLSSPETPQDDLDRDPTYEDDNDAFPPVSDENVVNSYLAGFASLVTMSVQGVKAHWSQERKGFKVRNEGTKLYEARTDGHLFSTDGKHTKAIVEVKPMMRDASTRVMMQETAEMAAWIHAEPDEIQGCANDKRFLRLLFSMNRHEIYLIIAEYNVDYVDYLINPNRKSECQSFLTMNQFGPWDIARAKDMETIGSVILAVTLHFSKSLPLIQPPPSEKKK
ncbi:uncharacterized protein BO80DRAFT_409290 [Aspergillus ibericus CBS 121593]|uniref:Uncharacterized protein n=1 Tax=Aspergillus ibericus CBS 121593 TaxID=1448316 RepID=A0A395GWY0_9EURO|nr:hypothetical protein BO80DRAFT_409290 [Aspergillus ibericus CBS 121593]RAL00036.1 hypothetical protein BO80DRAFT_409290 [Aspergillus ibericus CBS 121593]